MLPSYDLVPRSSASAKDSQKARHFAECQNSARLELAAKPKLSRSARATESHSLVAIYPRRAQSSRRRVTNLAATDAASTSRSSGSSRKTDPGCPHIAFLMFPGKLSGCHVL